MPERKGDDKDGEKINDCLFLGVVCNIVHAFMIARIDGIRVFVLEYLKVAALAQW